MSHGGFDWEVCFTYASKMTLLCSSLISSNKQNFKHPNLLMISIENDPEVNFGSKASIQ